MLWAQDSAYLHPCYQGKKNCGRFHSSTYSEVQNKKKIVKWCGKKKPEGVITFIGKDLSLAETWLIFFWREHSAQSIFLLRKVREHRSKESHFSRFNIYAVVRYLFVSFWLTSLHMTHSRSIQLVQFSSSVVSDSLWPHKPHAACQVSLSITNSQSSPKPMSVKSVMPSNHLTLCRPLLLLPSILPSIRVFSNESTLRMRWPKYWSFSFSISPSNEYSWLISFRIDWFNLLPGLTV